MSNPIILIGPLKAGKSTAGKLLAAELGWPFHSLDRLERRYTEPAGFDPEYARQLQQTEGDWAWYEYRRRFFPAAVAGFLAEHPAGVLELGGGHPIAADPAGQAQIAATLAPYRHVILLIPSHDRRTSRHLLNSRLRPEWQPDDWNRHFLADDRYWQLATHVVLTEGKGVEATVGELKAALPRTDSRKQRSCVLQGPWARANS